jgi:hypothetical protein
MRSLHFLVAVFTLSCGGIAVFEDGGGGNGNAGSGTAVGPSGSSGATKTTTSASGATKGVSASAATGASICDELEVARAKAFAEATRCNACIDFNPCGQGFVTDRCGCVVPATSQMIAELSEQAYFAWTAAGCGPLDCNAPCRTGSATICAADDGCGGVCSWIQ